MNEEKNLLRTQTMQRYRLLILKNGLQNIFQKPSSILFAVMAAVICILAAVALSFHRMLLFPCYMALLGVLYLLALLAICFRSASVPKAREIINNLLRVGIVNYAGEVPLPIRWEKYTEQISAITFASRGMPYKDWEEWRTKLETAMDILILSITPGSRPSETIIEYATGDQCYGDKYYWNGTVPGEDFKLAVGYDVAHRLCYIDLAKTPHWLICGATGMGKSKLAQLLTMQINRKNAHLIIADWKGGLDYPASIRGSSELVTDEETLLAKLEMLTSEMKNRRQLFLQAGAANITEYNIKKATPLPRYILLIDEASIILDPTGRSKADKDKIAAILNGLNTIGRLARAYGIHLIVCTQRADVNSIPGSLKAQLDGRMSAHAADDQSSIVIMGDGVAAELPPIPGRFVMRDISGSYTVFQAFLIDNIQKE